MKQKLNWATVIQLFKFGIVGVTNNIVALGVYYLFLWINKDWYLLGNIIGWIISVANAFFWNNKYVFKCGGQASGALLKRLLKSYLSYGATFVISTVLLYFEVSLWGWSIVLSPILNLFLTIPINFLLNKFWTFS